MKYHALFWIFEKAAKFEIVVCCKLLVKDDAQHANSLILKILNIMSLLSSLHTEKFCMLFSPSADFFQKFLSGILYMSSNSWIQIRTDILSVLIWVQTVCKNYQQTTLVGKELKKTWKGVFSSLLLISTWITLTHFLLNVHQGSFYLSEIGNTEGPWKISLNYQNWETWFHLKADL